MNICKGLAAQQWLTDYGEPSPTVDHKNVPGTCIAGELVGELGGTQMIVQAEHLPLWEKTNLAHGLDQDTGILVVWSRSLDVLIIRVANRLVDNSALTPDAIKDIATRMGRELGVR